MTTPQIHTDTLPSHWIVTQQQLATLIAEIESTQTIAIDTEFIKRTTYHPILALIQINTGKAVYLIDAPALDLAALWQALIAVPTLVWYACSEDLAIFYHLANNPPLTNIFDVQIGMAYLTGQLQIGYAQAVQDMLGICLDKGQSQSDWLARPLSQEQHTYAENDVRYLLALYHNVKHVLEQKHLFEYVKEDCQHHANSLHHSQHISDDERYLEYIAPQYNRRQLTALKHLVMWRESLARSANIPCTFIISKQALREIVMHLPVTIKELAQTTLNRTSLRKYGKSIIDIIITIKALSNEQLCPLPTPIYTSKAKPFKTPLNHTIAQYSTAINVPSNLLVRGRWINQLLYMIYQNLPTNHLPPEMTGYRYQWTTTQLLPLLSQFRQDIIDGFEAPK